MLEEGNTWSVDVYYDPFDPSNPPNPYTVTKQIALGDIEVVNGLDYYRVWSGDQPTCLLREENGIVYEYDEGEEIDKILFDYTLEQGDSFNLIGSAYDPFSGLCSSGGVSIWEAELTVSSVEELVIAGQSRKVITFLQSNSQVQFQWLEGIGNISGFDMLWEQVDLTNGSQLVCFTTYGVTYFFNGATSCDNTTLSVSENLKTQIILYPNPVANKSILQIPSEAEIDQLRIYNITGKLIKEEVITTNYYILNDMDFASGLYFYQVSSKGKSIKTEKFIVK